MFAAYEREAWIETARPVILERPRRERPAETYPSSPPSGFRLRRRRWMPPKAQMVPHARAEHLVFDVDRRGAHDAA